MIKTALEYFGHDYEFAHSIPGLPTKLSDVKGLEIGSFQTNDGVKLTYWKAGKGTPLVFVPGWSSNGAEYINLIHLLKDKYEVYVLDQRNHGLLGSRTSDGRNHQSGSVRRSRPDDNAAAEFSAHVVCGGSRDRL